MCPKHDPCGEAATRRDGRAACGPRPVETWFEVATQTMRTMADGWFGLWLGHSPERGTGSGNGDSVTTAIAHELRTPLTTIRSIAEILQDNPDLPPQQRERFQRALVEESARLQHSIDRLLEASTAGDDRWCVEAASFLPKPEPEPARG